MKKLLLFVLTSSLFISFNVTRVLAQDSEIALGASLSEYQQEEILSFFGESTEADYVTIDGNKVNEHLNDGSDNSVGIFSSAKVEFMDPGYGVHVYIITPENITEVSESMYRNAAIVAGANNVNIQIAAPQQVTGEGALAGVYEIFAQRGMVLNSEDIQLAEKQIQIEQFLAENTNLNLSEISRLITEINLTISIGLDDKESLTEEGIAEIINTIIDNNSYELSNDVISRLIEHGLAFSQSSVAKDPETRKALEAALASYKDLDDVFAKEFEVLDGVIKLNEVRILQPGQENNFMDYPILGIWYSFTLNEDADSMPAMFAWMQSVQVIQDNNPNVVNELMIDILPDERFLESQMHDLKPGGTAEMAVSYRLSDDFQTPIQVKFYSDIFREKLSDEVVLNISGLQ